LYEIQNEIRGHLDELCAAHHELGAAPAEAMRAAIAQFGPPKQLGRELNKHIPRLGVKGGEARVLGVIEIVSADLALILVRLIARPPSPSDIAVIAAWIVASTYLTIFCRFNSALTGLFLVHLAVWGWVSDAVDLGFGVLHPVVQLGICGFITGLLSERIYRWQLNHRRGSVA
jgi:hypothetical protein